MIGRYTPHVLNTHDTSTTNHTGSDTGIFDRGGGRGGGPNFSSERTVGLLRQITSPPHPLPPVAVARYNSLAAYRLFEPITRARSQPKTTGQIQEPNLLRSAMISLQI